MALHLFHGDCGEILPSVPTAGVDCIVTDVPYGVAFKSKATDYDDTEEAVFSRMPTWYAEWFRVLKEDSYLYVFTGVRNIERWICGAKDAGFTFKNIIATRSFNNSARVDTNFAFVFQPILVFAKGKGRVLNRFPFFRTSAAWLADERNVEKDEFNYNYPNFVPTDVAYGTEVFGSTAKKRDWHPNAKNAKLIAFLVCVSTERYDTVLDPFMGCGTTGEAALTYERHFIGIEKDSHWFDVARKRLEKTAPLFR